jgi:uncharacterized protein (TIGR04540 family)
MVTYFKSQKDLAVALIQLIDNYWNYELSEENLINQINELSSKNKEKLFIDGQYSSVLKQRLGKRRIELLNKVLTNRG